MMWLFSGAPTPALVRTLVNFPVFSEETPWKFLGLLQKVLSNCVLLAEVPGVAWENSVLHVSHIYTTDTSLIT